MKTITVYDNYEIAAFGRFNTVGKIDPTSHTLKPCDDDVAEVWVLYAMIDGARAGAIGEYPDRGSAEEAYRRIVGEPFAGPKQAGARLKLMHAAPTLLAACQAVVENWERGDLAAAVRACNNAADLATEPCPPWASAEFDIAQVLADRQQIASIWSIEDVLEVRPDLTDPQAWEVLKAADHYHDASVGINWEVLSSHAELLYGDHVDEADGS